MNSLSTVGEGAGRYIHWGVIQISVANFAIIAAMVVLFVLALVVPFPSGHGQDTDQERRDR
jgi:large-conductance mechanosensitive channel